MFALIENENYYISRYRISIIVKKIVAKADQASVLGEKHRDGELQRISNTQTRKRHYVINWSVSVVNG